MTPSHPPPNWIDRRQGYRYRGVLFSEDGHSLRRDGHLYRECAFPARAQRRFRLWLALVLLGIFPGVPLLAAAGWQADLVWLVTPALVLMYWLHRRIHACPRCGSTTQVLKTPYNDSPVLYLCSRCHTFFEHGQIDGGLPWK